ncbi:serine/threonine-protein kinase [Streptomyces sp. NPDC055078]
MTVAVDGQTIDGRYILRKRIGAGGMGVVWLAWDQVLERWVALKCARVSDGAEAERLRKEARNAGRLHHPNIVSVLHFFTDSTGCWIVMEYVPARSLRQLLDERVTLPPEEAGALGCQVADALAVSHRAGVVHGDVTPGNILVTEDGVAKLTDFGISRVLDGDTTVSGGLRGTPRYLPPEVAQAKRAGHASDVFSLGATLYRAVEGRSPYGDAEGPIAYLRLAAEGRVLPPVHSGPLTVPLTEMLRVDPEHRPTAAQARELMRTIPVPPTVGQGTGDDARRDPDGLRRQADDTTVPAPPPDPTVPAPPPDPTLRALPPEPDPHPSPRPPSRWRPRAKAVTGVVVATALLLTVVITRPWESGREPDDDAPPKGPVAAIMDARRADPCSMLDSRVLARFGHPQTDPDYGAFDRCDVLISGNRGGAPFADVEVNFSSDPVEADSQARTEQAGRVTVSEVPGDPDECVRNIQLTDAHHIWVKASQVGDRKSDLCAIVEAATDYAVKVLNLGPVPERPAPFAQNSLARLDACGLPDVTSLGTVAGVDAQAPDPHFANWSCAWESESAGTEVSLDFSRDNDLEDDGRMKALGGRKMYVAPEDHGDDTCVVRTEHRGYKNAYGDHTIELVTLAVRGDQPVSELCDTAEALSAEVARKLPAA